MSRELPPPVLSVSLVKIELPTVIKNEPSESEIVRIGIEDILDSSESEEDIIPDVKDLDIVYHPVCDDSIKSEILESKYCESVETQVLIKAENSLFIKTENITRRSKTEGPSHKNVIKGTDQGVVEVQGSNQSSNVLSNLETDTQLVLNFSKDLNISTRTRKAKHSEKTNFAIETTSWEKNKEKIYIIKAPVILVKPYEYTSLAKDKHVCNHCQRAYKTLKNLKCHIKRMHREVTTMYQCPYCSLKSKWKSSIQFHIIQKHKDTKEIQWFQCNLCEMKFKLKSYLTGHMKVHLKYKGMEDGLGLKRYHCNNFDYKTDHHYVLKKHNLIHLKPEEIEYFYCYHCSYKSKEKGNLKRHIFTHHFKREKSYHCDNCHYKTDCYVNLKKHKLVHLKQEEIQFLYCYHCSHKSKRKDDLKKHIFMHCFKNFNQEKRYHCNKCNYRTDRTGDLNRHKLNHLKPEDIPYFHCYHCSYKAKRKGNLQCHIFKHFKKGQVKFDCYICSFMTQKRESIIKHIKKHSKDQIKFEINEGS